MFRERECNHLCQYRVVVNDIQNEILQIMALTILPLLLASHFLFDNSDRISIRVSLKLFSYYEYLYTTVTRYAVR